MNVNTRLDHLERAAQRTTDAQQPEWPEVIVVCHPDGREEHIYTDYGLRRRARIAAGRSGTTTELTAPATGRRR